MLGLVWWTVFTSLARAGCDDFGALVDQAEQAVIRGRTAEAATSLRQAEAALGCGPVPDPRLLGRMWLAEGARAYAEGDAKVTKLAFAAAYRVAPDLWVDGYGPQVRLVYLSDRVPEVGEGSVRIKPDPEGWSTTLDGRSVDFPVKAAPGLHLLQVGETSAATAYAEIFYLPVGQTYFVLTGLAAPALAAAPEPPAAAPEPPAAAPEPPAPAPDPPAVEAPPAPEVVSAGATGAPPLDVPAAPTPDPAGGFSSPIFLVVGGAAAVFAGGAALGALAQDQRMENAVNMDSLDRAYSRQVALASAAYGLGGAAALSLTLHFVLKF